MVRTVLIPDKTDIHLSIPKEYVGKRIEITYLDLDELESKTSSKKTMGDFCGILAEPEYELLKIHSEQARKEWDRTI